MFKLFKGTKTLRTVVYPREPSITLPKDCSYDEAVNKAFQMMHDDGEIWSVLIKSERRFYVADSDSDDYREWVNKTRQDELTNSFKEVK